MKYPFLFLQHKNRAKGRAAELTTVINPGEDGQLRCILCAFPEKSKKAPFLCKLNQREAVQLCIRF